MIDQQQMDELIRNRSESRSVEIKRWIDPTSKAGMEKIAKGLLALRNFNGGFFIVGFDDDTLKPDVKGEPSNPQSLFHADAIQLMISRFAFESFETEVGWAKFDGRKYPIIQVPPGVKQPVAAKRDLLEDNKRLIREGAVYFRTLSSNGTVSSAEAKPSDWREIVDICFANREADVGSFLRRHLSGIDLGELLKSLNTFVPTVAMPTLREDAALLLEDGEARFGRAIADRKLAEDERPLLTLGFWSAALVINPPHMGAIADHNFSSVLGASNPRYTGWPVWMDARFKEKTENREKYIDNAIEYLIVSTARGWSKHVDFARLDPVGRFFLHRLTQDDGVPDKVAP